MLVLIQSCNRHEIHVSLNKPSDANVCCALCHNTAFIFVTYIPQVKHSKQICNRKQTLGKRRYNEWNKLLNNLNFPFGKKMSSQHMAWKVWLIAKGLTIFLLSVVEHQRTYHTKFYDLVHEIIIIKGNIEWCIIFIAYFRKWDDFLKSYWVKNDLISKLHSFTIKP